MARGRHRLDGSGAGAPRTPSRSVRLPVADGESLMAWFDANWRRLGFESATGALVEAWRAFARAEGWRSPAADVDLDEAPVPPGLTSALLGDRPDRERWPHGGSYKRS